MILNKNKVTERRQRMAVGALSHLIGAFYLLGSLICDCDAQRSNRMRTLLLHLKGCYWVVMDMKFDIKNPKKSEETKEL